MRLKKGRTKAKEKAIKRGGNPRVAKARNPQGAPPSRIARKGKAKEKGGNFQAPKEKSTVQRVRGLTNRQRPKEKL
jgi:hypothetical protein